MTGYYPRFSIREDLDGGAAAWLAEQQGVGPLRIEDVTDICATHGVPAELRDEQGSLRGRVDAKGDYTLV